MAACCCPVTPLFRENWKEQSSQNQFRDDWKEQSSQYYQVRPSRDRRPCRRHRTRTRNLFHVVHRQAPQPLPDADGYRHVYGQHWNPLACHALTSLCDGPVMQPWRCRPQPELTSLQLQVQVLSQRWYHPLVRHYCLPP
jgi:hypothetical protein